MSKRKAPPDAELIRLYEVEGMTCPQIAEIYGMRREAAARAVKNAGANMREPKGKNHGMWKGGRVTCLSGGYVGIWMPSHPSASKVGYVYEHTLVMENKLKRHLTKDENIHHIDMDKLNNQESNLYIFSHKGHAECHRSIEKLINPLLKSGVIRFENGVYVLNK